MSRRFCFSQEPALHDGQYFLVNNASRAAGIYHDDPLRFALGDLEIFISDALEKSATLFFETILVFSPAAGERQVATPRALDARRNIGVHEYGEIRLYVAAKDAMQIEDRLTAKASPAALIRLR